MAETIFTKIMNREIPADIVYEDDISLAFKDINPQAPVHLLIIPKQEIATINDIEEGDRELVGHLYWVAKIQARRYSTSTCTCWPASPSVGRRIPIK